MKKTIAIWLCSMLVFGSTLVLIEVSEEAEAFVPSVTTVANANVLLVDADIYASTLMNFYIWPLQNCSVNITVWDVYGNNGPVQGKPTAVDMGPYDAVFWVPDVDMSWSGAPFDNTDEIEVATYLDNGGNFFLSNIQYTDYTDGGSCFYSPGDFAYDYLGIDSVNGWSGNEYSVNATIGDLVFGGIGPCIQDWNVEPWLMWGGFPPWMSDDVYPGLGTICFFNDDGGGWQEPAGIRYDGGTFKTIFFGFPLETLSFADANVIMNRTMTWFSTTLGIPQMTISKNAPANANPGETILYTITYQNVGTDTAYNVTITDTYPSGVTFIDSNPAPTVGNNTWIVGDVPAGSGGTIYVNVSVELWATGTLTNWVDLDYEDVMGFPQPTESDFAATTVLLASGPVHNIDTDEYFLTISEGIADTDTLNGHTLEVASGVYSESVNVNKELDLVGEDRSTTIINMGIDVNADNVLLTGFTLTGAGCCNHMWGSNINITRNNFTSNPYAGIWLFSGSNYYITENEIHANEQGIYVSPTCNNVNIYHNNFIDNLIQAEDFGSTAFWDNGYPSGGNYWSDYNGSDIFSGPLQNITGSDGIGDTPYFLNFNQDGYPLMAPWNSIDLQAPDHSNEYPGINMGTGDQSTVISVHVTDNVAVNVSSIRLYVMGFPVFYDLSPIPGGYNISYTHIVDYPEGPVLVRIVARDTSDNLLDFTWTFYIDLSPPEAWDMDPPPGGVTEDTTPIIQLNVTDVSSGVVLSTLRLYVQGFPVLYDHYTITNGFHIYYAHLVGFVPGEFVQCRILAEDHSGQWLDYSWNFTIADVLTVEIPVQVGWNLISFPVIPDNTSLPVVLQDLGGDTTWENIQWYDPLDTADHWKTYATFKPPFLNDLTDVTRSMSVWLYVPDAGALGDGLIKITGLESVSTTIPLYAGWNLVGYPSQVDRTVQDALAGTGYDVIEGFDPGAEYYLKELANDYVMKACEGYWIHVPVDTVWILDW